MKKIKMKDTILSHYQKVHELEMGGITVRVFKPRTMQQLPAYRMLRWIKNRAEDAIDWMKIENTTYWGLGNPDLGMWDAQTVYHYDPRHKAFNIYFAAILLRPFSEQAYGFYNTLHENVDDVNHRLMLMWDSRDFDSRNGTTTNYGMNGIDLAKYQNYIYQVREPERDPAEQEDIEDTSASYFGDAYVKEPEENRRCVKLRVEDDNIVYNAIMGRDEAKKDGGTPLMHACAKTFCDFRKDHPEVTEMHFYTDELLDVQR